MRRTPRYTLFPYTTLFRSENGSDLFAHRPRRRPDPDTAVQGIGAAAVGGGEEGVDVELQEARVALGELGEAEEDLGEERDRKSTRLNSSHVRISYAVFCLK